LISKYQIWVVFNMDYLLCISIYYVNFAPGGDRWAI
jgi:hypothetical protein